MALLPMKVVETTTMTILRDLITETWDSLLGRVAIIGAAVGWVPFVLLTMAVEQLRTAA